MFHSQTILNGDYLLIDPSLPIGEIIRCDQLIFFTNGIATPMLNTGTTDFAGQGLGFDGVLRSRCSFSTT